MRLFGVFALATVAVGCGEAPPSSVTVDSGRQTPFIDAGRADAGVDAGVDAGSGFIWADAGSIDAGWIFGAGDGGFGWGDDGGCQMTMCLTGAPNRGGSNEPFDVICDNAAVPNVIRSCDSINCYNTFNTFLVDAKGSIYSKLFAALDTNGDNLVNASDTFCRVNLLGYSWGGIAAVQIAEKLSTDTRVDAQSRRIKRLFVMDPYQPGATVRVPTNVERFIEFRHSQSPSNDCSNGALGGPYEGVQPRCYPNQSCYDFDYSQSPSVSFPANGGGFYVGSQVGHCEVPAVAAVAILADFKNLPMPTLPASMPISVP